MIAANSSIVGSGPANSSPQPATAGASGISPIDTIPISEPTRPCIATGVMWVKKPCSAAFCGATLTPITAYSTPIHSIPGTSGTIAPPSAIIATARTARNPVGTASTSRGAAIAPARIAAASTVFSRPIRAAGTPAEARSSSTAKVSPVIPRFTATATPSICRRIRWDSVQEIASRRSSSTRVRSASSARGG